MSGCPVKAGEAGGDAEGDEGEREGDDAPVAVEAVEGGLGQGVVDNLERHRVGEPAPVAGEAAVVAILLVVGEARSGVALPRIERIQRLRRVVVRLRDSGIGQVGDAEH